ncbi:hypothetical protein AVEN_232370-1 [Araneus ventricosus]|uniref:Uncharacterized protein n=1 Tax=Araneus ventricosus TaxID=182803 RepID=A0A4Y2WCS3_ARAVE|nr:hypothetical protein AVEN_232370-1 [Araneus ventricosus]
MRLRASPQVLHFMEVKSKEVTSGYASSSITTGAAFHGGKVERGHQWITRLSITTGARIMEKVEEVTVSRALEHNPGAAFW